MFNTLTLSKTEMYGTVSVKSMEEISYDYFTKRKLEVSQEGVNK